MKNFLGNFLVWLLIIATIILGIDLFVIRPDSAVIDEQIENKVTLQLYETVQTKTPPDWESLPGDLLVVIPDEPENTPDHMPTSSVDHAVATNISATANTTSAEATYQKDVQGQQSKFRIFALLLAFLGLPLFAVLGAISLYISPVDTMIFIDATDKLVNQDLFISLPLFTLAGYILSESKAPERLIRFSRALLGWFPGGTVFIVAVSCAFFTALTGASGVTIIALGGLLYPMLRKDQYSENFTLGLITSGGSLGLLFPPSLPLILYAVIAQNSMQGLQGSGLGKTLPISQLFLAAFIPGVLMVLVLAIYGAFFGLRHHHQTTPFSLKEFAKSTMNALPELLIPVFIIVLLFNGYMHINQTAACSALYILIIETVWYRDIKISQLPRIFRRSMIMIGAILIILMMAMAMTSLLIMNKVPDQLLDYMKVHIQSPLTFLIYLNIFLLLVGCLMDIFSATLVVVPLIVPIALHFQIDPLHLGVIFLLNLSLGYCTPPVGMNLFLTSLRFQRSIFKITYTCLPFLFLLLLVLLLVTYIPAISIEPANNPWWIGVFGIVVAIVLGLYSFLVKFLFRFFAEKKSAC